MKLVKKTDGTPHYYVLSGSRKEDLQVIRAAKLRWDQVNRVWWTTDPGKAATFIAWADRQLQAELAPYAEEVRTTTPEERNRSRKEQQ